MQLFSVSQKKNFPIHPPHTQYWPPFISLRHQDALHGMTIGLYWLHTPHIILKVWITKRIGPLKKFRQNGISLFCDPKLGYIAHHSMALHLNIHLPPFCTHLSCWGPASFALFWQLVGLPPSPQNPLKRLKMPILSSTALYTPNIVIHSPCHHIHSHVEIFSTRSWWTFCWSSLFFSCWCFFGFFFFHVLFSSH